MKKTIYAAFLMVVMAGCRPNAPSAAFPAPDFTPLVQPAAKWGDSLSREAYYDKVLGALVGSAIGDAMGAPTEMWHRSYIVQQWGYVNRLTPLLREASAEGSWEDNLPAGGTTDDTRWKYIAVQYLLRQPARPAELSPQVFNTYLLDLYAQAQREVRATTDFEPEPMERELMHVAWLQEWAKVAKPFVANDLEGYADALSRFYGGEMVCAGMLYAPALGLAFPADPVRAYEQGFRLATFDIGYARDITALTAALVAQAMTPHLPADRITEVCQTIDPRRFADSRLTGRMAAGVYQDAKYIAFEAMAITAADPALALPKHFPYDALYYTRLQKAYALLDERLQKMPFHAAEIHLINLTALEFAGADFRKAIEFVTNYGRDNDTVGAVTGAIVGAWLGFHQLPPDLANQVITTNKTVTKLDLAQLAHALTDLYFK